MRVLIIPELYRRADASANATLNDAVTWVEQWLAIDDAMHVYWLLPHRGDTNYEREYVLADRDRVTLIEADTFMAGNEYEWLFTESGYSEDQLFALKREIYDELGYVDVVVDQLRQGRKDLYKWLLYLAGHRPTEAIPFDVIVNVHDLMLPVKYPGDGYRVNFHRQLEVTESVLAEGIWFKARLDADGLPVFGREFLRESVIDDALGSAVLTNSPIDFSAFVERYRDEPKWFHVAGSGWEKKHVDVVMEIAKLLHDEYGIRTLMTSMDEIPRKYARQQWVEAHSQASREVYERALQRGDITVCATEYDTMARTWFEQAASGQVLVLRDEPWLQEVVPQKSPLVVPLDELPDRVRWVVENWDDAVVANQRLMEHVRKIRSPRRAGRMTYDDLVRRVDEKIDRYTETLSGGETRRRAVARAVDDLESDAVGLEELDERGEGYTDDGEAFLEQEWCTITDLVFTLRWKGYTDTGRAGTPVFRTSQS